MDHCNVSGPCGEAGSATDASRAEAVHGPLDVPAADESGEDACPERDSGEHGCVVGEDVHDGGDDGSGEQDGSEGEHAPSGEHRPGRVLGERDGDGEGVLLGLRAGHDALLCFGGSLSLPDESNYTHTLRRMQLL